MELGIVWSQASVKIYKILLKKKFLALSYKTGYRV